MAGVRTLLPVEFTKLSTRVILACTQHPQVLLTYAIFESLAWGADSRTIEFDGAWFETQFGVSQPTLLRHLSLLSKQPIQAVLCYRSAGAGYRRFSVTLAEMTPLEMSGIKNDTSGIKFDTGIKFENHSCSLIKESINPDSIKDKNGIKNDTVSNLIPEGQPEEPSQKPNIFRLYEENIGPLTPLVADALRSAESDYPEPWITEAFAIACEQNKRRWAYILGVLKNFKEQGFTPRSANEKPDQRNRSAGSPASQNPERGAPPTPRDLAAAELVLQMQNLSGFAVFAE